MEPVNLLLGSSQAIVPVAGVVKRHVNFLASSVDAIEFHGEKFLAMGLVEL